MRVESDEESRLKALESFAIMDTPPEKAFDEITRLAALALNAPSCAISLVDQRRQWFKSRVGIDFCETPRDQAFCQHAISGKCFLEVSDATKDPRFADNPLVTAPGGIRFYAGAPIVVDGDHYLGTLCVFDSKPRPKLGKDHKQALSDLAKLAADLIESRRFQRLGEITRKVVDVTSDAILCVDRAGVIAFWNRAAEQMFGHGIETALGSSLDLILPKELAGAHHHDFRRAIAGAPTPLVGTTVELSARRACGEEFPIELSLARLCDDRTGGGFAAIIRDSSVRKSLERDRQHAQDFLDAIVANLPAMLFVKDADTRQYLLVNRSGEDLIGRPASEIVGRTDSELFPDVGSDYERRDTQALSKEGIKPFESDFLRDDGEVVTLRTKRIVVDGPDRTRQYILGLSEDVTEMRRAEAQVIQLAQFDSLTGLRNRASLVELLHKAMATGSKMAILSIDLDRFKYINDQFGHPTGDAVLAEVGRRLSRVARTDDIVARVGGDEFMIIVMDDAPAASARRIAQAVVRAIGEPFVTDRFTAHTGASIGIVIAPDDAKDTEELRQAVDLALYRAKAQARGSVCFFSAEMDAAAKDRRTLEHDLRIALENGEISIAYQPVVSTQTGQITSAEALARWTHPTRGPIAPDVFISIAEECGVIEMLGERVLQKACRDAAQWPRHIRVAVNLSPLQFEGGDLVHVVQTTLQDSGLEPSRLQLEVTEGLLIRNVDQTFEILSQLRGLGIQILMDDFGVGYSSLSYFERFPFDKVKIDRSFVQKITQSNAARAIVHAVVGLGTTLGMGIVAEGVETQDQMELLTATGCTHMQGYLFSRPIPADTFVEILGGADDPGGEWVPERQNAAG